MERLQKWFGVSRGEGESEKASPGKGDNRVLGISVFPHASRPQSQHQSQQTTPLSSSSGASAETAPASAVTAPASAVTPAVFQPPVPPDAQITETRMGQLMNEGREMILKVVPLVEGDCLSCKLVGSGVMWGAAAYVALSYPKAKTRFPGFKRKLFTAQVVSLVTGLTLLGAARMFDLSLFAPPDEDGKRKSFAELLKEDLDGFHKLGTKIFETKNSSESRKDS